MPLIRGLYNLCIFLIIFISLFKKSILDSFQDGDAIGSNNDGFTSILHNGNYLEFVVFGKF